jgi:hypothetical protein
MDIHPPGSNIFNWFRAEYAITRGFTHIKNLRWQIYKVLVLVSKARTFPKSHVLSRTFYFNYTQVCYSLLYTVTLLPADNLASSW